MKRQREFLVEARFNLSAVSNGCGKEVGGGRKKKTAGQDGKTNSRDGWEWWQKQSATLIYRQYE